MEGFYRPSSRITDYSTLIRGVHTRKSQVGIASLSDTKENELMWTHYADNYAGICIEYYGVLKAILSEVGSVRMSYDDRPPRVSSSDARHIAKEARKIFFQKSLIGHTSENGGHLPY
jgi:hypothetical protein